MKNSQNLFNKPLINNKSTVIEAYKSLANRWHTKPDEIISSKYFDDKDFVLEYIHEKYFNIAHISERLKSDREIVLKWLTRQKKMPRHLPEICFNDPFIINFIIENKKDDSFNFVESLDHSFQTKKNILRSFGHSKNILVPKSEQYEDCLKIPSSHPKNLSLFENFHVASWEHFSPPWKVIKKSKTYDDLEIKKQALRLSPKAAYLFMLNNEITLEEYADIVIDYALSTPTPNVLPFPFGGTGYYGYHESIKITMKRLWISGVDFSLLQNAILDAFFKKTKSIDKLFKFRCNWPIFNTINASKHISENIDINKIKDSKIGKFLYECRFLDKDYYSDDSDNVSLNNPYHPLFFMHKKIESKKCTFLKYIEANPKKAAEHIFHIAYASNIHPYQSTYRCDEFKHSYEIKKFYDNLDEKVKSSKLFLIEFKEMLHISNYYEDGFVRTFLDDITKRTIEHIESNKDFEFLKKIISYQSTFDYRHHADNESYSKLFYFKISDKLKTREIMEYFLLKNPNFLIYDPEIKFGQKKDPRNAPFCKPEQFNKIVNSKFYFKLFAEQGLTCFEENHIPPNLLDNKKFMIQAVIKSYQSLKYASERIKSDPDVLKFACMKNTQSFKYASISSKKNKRLLDNIFHDKPEEKFLRAHITIKTDKDICVPAFKSNMSLAKKLSLKRLQKIKPKWFKSELDRKKLFEIFCNKLGEDDLLLIAKYKRDFGFNKQETSNAYA